MEALLFKTVECKGYLQKQKTKYVFHSNTNDTYIEDESSITLTQGGTCEQDIYKFIDKPFEGICVGIFLKEIKREYADNVIESDYTQRQQVVLTRPKESIKVAKVYFSNNKSRLVPIEKIKIWKSPF